MPPVAAGPEFILCAGTALSGPFAPAFKSWPPPALWASDAAFAYKRERARRAGKLDEARRLLKAVELLRERYCGERELHTVRAFGLTVH